MINCLPVSLLTILLTVHDVNSIIGENSMATVGQFKYAVSIMVMLPSGRAKHICTGGIIDMTHVLTAGHCINVHVIPLRMGVVVGRISLPGTRGPNIIPVARVFQHRDYLLVGTNDPERYLYENDIAVLKLRRSLEESETIGPIPLTDTANIPYDTMCMIAGWGVTTATPENTSPNLLWTNAVFQKSQDCPDLMSHQSCVSNPCGFSHTGKGDSGGLINCNGIAVALISGSTPEAGHTVVVQIFPYLGFIERVINGSEQPYPFDF